MYYLHSPHRRPQPEAACSKDPTRTALINPYLELENARPRTVVRDGGASGDREKAGREKEEALRPEGWLVACDSYVLAALPVRFHAHEAPSAGPVPTGVFAQARKHRAEIEIHERTVSISDGNGVKMTLDRPEGGESFAYPQWRNLIPERTSVFRFALDVGKLVQLAKAFGDEKIVLEFVAPQLRNGEEKTEAELLAEAANRPIRVRPLDHLSSSEQGLAPVGVLMPIRIAG